MFSRCKEVRTHIQTHTYKYLPDSTRWITPAYGKYYPRHKSWDTTARAVQQAAVLPSHSETQRKVVSRFVSSALHWASWPGSVSYYLLWLDLKVYLFHCTSFYRGALALGYREKDAILCTTVNLQGDLSCSAEVCFFRVVLLVCEDVLRQDLQKACSMSLWFCYHKQEPSQDHQVLSCTRPFRHFTARFMAVINNLRNPFFPRYFPLTNL